MKKNLSLLMLMLLCTTAWAETVTFAFNTDEGLAELGITKPSAGNGTEITSDLVKDGVTITPTDGGTPTRVWNSSGSTSLRVYKNNNGNNGTLTFTAGDNEITSIVVKNGANGVSMSGATNGTWTGSATSVMLEATANVTITTIDVTYTESQPATVATPVINFLPSAPYAGDVTTCTITCATEGATIYYTTDGNTPDATCNVYDSTNKPTMTETTTVKAIAILDNVPSAVAEKTVTFTPVTTVANIAELTQLTDGTIFRMTGSATVVGEYAGQYTYIKDDTGSTLLYNVISGTVTGYTISNIVGKVQIHNGLFEVTQATFDTQPDVIVTEPVVMAIPDITADNMNQYVVIKGVTLSDVDGRNMKLNDADGNQFPVYSQNFCDFPTDLSKIYDVTGFVAVYNEKVQLYPSHFEDVTPAPAVETPVIEFDKENPVEGETVNCTITCATQGATIMYALGEGNFQEYTAAIPLTQTTTVKAKAVLGQDESSVATATITFATAPVEYGNFQLVTSENDLEIGKNYVIVTTAHDFAMGALTTGSNPKGSSATGFTLNNNIVTLDNNTDVMVLKLGKTNAGDLTLAMPDGKYINLTATSGTNITASESATTLTIAIDEDAVATIQGNTSRQILYQYGSANVFGNYASSNASNTTSYCTISLYKETEEVVPQPTYTITLDKQPGEYSTLINVKATVEPALPEGATLKYTIDGAAPVAYDAEKGVYLLKSSELKFTAYDAQNNALTDPVGGQYKYVVNVFGDMDGDGEVTVSDLNIVLNLILGKI